jgi:hypothetical protein
MMLYHEQTWRNIPKLNIYVQRPSNQLVQKIAIGRFQDIFILRHPQQISHVLSRQRVARELGILVIDDSSLNTSSRSSGISQKLSLATTIHLTKQRNGFVDSAASCQKTMILEDDGGIITEFFGDTMTFLRTENDTVTPND